MEFNGRNAIANKSEDDIEKKTLVIAWQFAKIYKTFGDNLSHLAWKSLIYVHILVKVLMSSLLCKSQIKELNKFHMKTHFFVNLIKVLNST